MAKFDVKVVGKCANLPFRVAASATRGYYGEPLIVAPTYSSGVASVNTVVVLTDDLPVIGTDQFVGILTKDMLPTSGTIVAQRVTAAVPRPNETRIRAKVTTSATADTESEAIGLLWDIYVFDLISSTYTWKPAAADTGGFTARWYNYVKSQLDCVADARAMTRVDIT